MGTAFAGEVSSPCFSVAALIYGGSNSASPQQVTATGTKDNEETNPVIALLLILLPLFVSDFLFRFVLLFCLLFLKLFFVFPLNDLNLPIKVRFLPFGGCFLFVDDGGAEALVFQVTATNVEEVLSRVTLSRSESVTANWVVHLLVWGDQHCGRGLVTNKAGFGRGLGDGSEVPDILQ